jgi:hypothetical protein
MIKYKLSSRREHSYCKGFQVMIRSDSYQHRTKFHLMKAIEFYIEPFVKEVRQAVFKPL